MIDSDPPLYSSSMEQGQPVGDDRIATERNAAGGKSPRSASHMARGEWMVAVLIVSLMLGWMFNHLADFGNEMKQDKRAEQVLDRWKTETGDRPFKAIVEGQVKR